MEIKEERLRILKEKLLLIKEKFEYLKNINSNFKDILHLREEIQKMVPLYLDA